MMVGGDDVAGAVEACATPHVAVARQPILNADWDVVAFELLYRSDAGGADAPSAEAMTAGVIVSSLSEIGLSELVGSRQAHVNVTREFLVGLGPWQLPRERVVLELLENQTVDRELLGVLRAAVAEGFVVALDDFRYGPEMEPLLELASVVKLDLRALSRWEVIDEVERLRSRDLRLVAEKVETAEEYEFCCELGFDAYQGFFFARPELVRRQRAPSQGLGTLCALANAGGAASFEELEAIISRDAGMSHKLLRFVNSAFVAPRHTVVSLRQALTRLGTVSIRRWAMLIALARLPDRPHVLLNTALVRARMGELLARESSAGDADRAFTVGLFSLLDVLVGVPMDELLTELPFDARIAQALVSGEGPEGRLLQAVRAYESGDFSAAASAIEPELLARSYRDALGWADGVSLSVAA